jgi:hypothetical protein
MLAVFVFRWDVRGPVWRKEEEAVAIEISVT